MKYYTEALVNEVKKKKKILGFFFGDWRRNCYYEARHREKDLYLLWIEGSHFGKVITYPCVLREYDKLMAYENGNMTVNKENNDQLVRYWGEVINPQILQQEFDLNPLDAKEFNAVFHKYQKQHLDEEIAKAMAAEGVEEEPAEEPQEAACAQSGQEKNGQ